MIGVGLSIVQLAVRQMLGGAFTPATLFANSEPGVWYDPSDLTTLFQDSAGTTPVTTVEQPVGKMLDKSGRGFHATQTTSTSRPVLSARYNLLTKTEQFDDGVWAKTNATVTANAAVAPDGTSTADLIIADTATGDHRILSSFTATIGTSYNVSVYAKQGFGSYLLAFNGFGTALNIGDFPVFNLQNGTVVTSGSLWTNTTITDAGNGWYRCSSYTVSASTTSLYLTLMLNSLTRSFTGDGTSGIYIWGASLVPSNQASLPYQRVNTATDYDTVGFPKYLKFDGSDDWLVTPTITPGIDKAQVFAGVRQLSVLTTTGQIIETSVDLGNNDGTLGLAWPAVNSASALRWQIRGTVFVGLNDTTATPPRTSVISHISDISNNSLIGRRDGIQVVSNTANIGTGNFLAYPLYIGRRAGTTSPFNGYIYSLIVRFGANLDNTTIEQTENWVNGKTLAY